MKTIVTIIAVLAILGVLGYVSNHEGWVTLADLETLLQAAINRIKELNN